MSGTTTVIYHEYFGEPYKTIQAECAKSRELVVKHAERGDMKEVGYHAERTAELQGQLHTMTLIMEILHNDLGNYDQDIAAALRGEPVKSDLSNAEPLSAGYLLDTVIMPVLADLQREANGLAFSGNNRHLISDVAHGLQTARYKGKMAGYVYMQERLNRAAYMLQHAIRYKMEYTANTGELEYVKLADVTQTKI